MSQDFPQPQSCILHEERLVKIERGISGLADKLDAIVALEGPIGKLLERMTLAESSIRSAHHRVDEVQVRVTKVERSEAQSGRDLNSLAVKVGGIAAVVSSIFTLGTLLAIFKLVGGGS